MRSKTNHFNKKQLSFEEWIKENKNLFIEEECDECGGEGEWDFHGEGEETCIECYGIGKIYTEKGTEVDAMIIYDKQYNKERKLIDNYK